MGREEDWSLRKGEEREILGFRKTISSVERINVVFAILLAYSNKIS